MHDGLYDVVKASLTGSIIGNVLLVLGLSICVGGLGASARPFDRAGRRGRLDPAGPRRDRTGGAAMFHFVGENAVHSARITEAREIVAERSLSLEIAIVLFVAYGLSLCSHCARIAISTPARITPARTSRWAPPAHRAGPDYAGGRHRSGGVDERSAGRCGRGAAPRRRGHEVFIGVIVVAVIGNAAEHSTAVLMAMKNKMDLAMNIAIGSSTQIALFVAPVLVFVSYAMPHGPMNLRFTPFEVLAVGLSVGVVNLVAQDGESNWLEGALLLAGVSDPGNRVLLLALIKEATWEPFSISWSWRRPSWACRKSCRDSTSPAGAPR
jgi:Ca2+:H+ antiporter